MSNRLEKIRTVCAVVGATCAVFALIVQLYVANHIMGMQ